MVNKSTWEERSAKINELKRTYPVLKDILQVYKVLFSFTFTQRSDKKHEDNFKWLENKLKEMSNE